MKEWYLPLRTPHDVNDATQFYIHTLEEAGRALGHALRIVDSVACIPHTGNVLAIECKTAFKIMALRPRCSYWLWLQGIVPEEIELQRKGALRKAYWTLFERMSIPRARGAVMVSEAMRCHFARKYGTAKLPSFIMPCTNMELDEGAFAVAFKYVRPSFVYAGSLDAWQCFDLTLEVFRRVRAAKPEATLTVLTAQLDAARARVVQRGIQGVTVSYIPIKQLQAELRKYKYGFVLREPHCVNAVATPTKVSSYMAAGVIPIMTTAVHDYSAHLGVLQCVIMSGSIDPAEIAGEILAFDQGVISPLAVLAEYRRLFQEYFDHTRYMPGLIEFLQRTGLTLHPQGHRER